MRAADALLAAAVAAAGAHVLLSMQLPVLAWLFAALAALAPVSGAFGWRRPLAPTPGLAFITFVSGGLLGYMTLADVVPVDSWAGDFAVFGGLCLSALVLMLWLLATRAPAPMGRAGDRAGDTLVVAVLTQSLLIPRAASAGTLTAALPWIGAGAALLALLAARLGARGLRRAWLLLVVLALMPAAEPALRAAQRPLVGALFSLLPEPHGETGFAPLARLRADGLLRPARRAVLRLWVTGGTPPPYLVGSRLTTLDGNYEWRAIEADRPTLAADAGDGEWRFRLAAGKPVWSVDIHSLRRDDFMFLPPGTQTVQAADSALSVDGAGALHGAFAQRAARRWHAAGGPTGAQPPAANENLSLPSFWTPELQTAARVLGGADAAQTAARIGAELRGRRYSLRYHLDPKAPFRDFFIGRKPAHCFWYATAAALALRANGVPSRLVTGYLVSEPLGGGAFLVRERDAHAWAEWQDGAGRWHTLDATPANYDAVLADYGGGAFERVWQRLAARLDARWQKIELTDAQVQAVLLAGLAVLVGLFVREYWRLRRVAPRIGHSREWQRLWRRFLRLSGLPERPQWTATDYLGHLPESWPPQRRAAARRFLEIYVAERFSPHGASVEAAAALRACRRRGLSG